MNRPKQWLLNAYYVTTLPYRRHRLATMRQTGTVPVMVLFYHRIAETVANDWTMSYHQFARQIDWLASRFQFVSLSEAQRAIASGDVRHPKVAITFDDGYGDNCRQALPLLMRRRIPCTYFVSTDHVLRGEPFPHDVASGQPLPCNTVDQLRSLAAGGIEIGAHTRTHCDLGKISDAGRIEAEVVGSKRELERALDCPIHYFAFPYGLPENLSEAALDVARRAGFQGVCSAYGDYNLPGDDPFHLRRIHADPEMSRFKNWLSIDPRKRRRPEAGEPPLRAWDRSPVGPCTAGTAEAVASLAASAGPRT